MMKYLLILTFFIYVPVHANSFFSFFSSVSDDEVKTWLKESNIDPSKISKKKFKQYKKEVKELSSGSYGLFPRGEKALRAEEFKSKIDSGELCSGNDAIKVNGSKESLYKYDEVFSKAMNDSPDISDNCRHRILQDYMQFKLKNDDPLKSRLCRRSECLLVKKITKRFEDSLTRLVSEVYGMENQQILCAEKNTFDSPDSLKSLIKSFEEIQSCEEVTVGRTKKVNTTLNNITQAYTITKKSENKYTASFQLDFGTDSFEIGGKRLDGDFMHEKIQGCLKNTNSYLKDSKGRNLNLEVFSPKIAATIPTYKRPPKVKIALFPEKSRAHSKAYPVDIECSTIVHELLHLTGLHDEYEEKINGQYVHKSNKSTIRVKSGSHNSPEDKDKYDFVADYNSCRSIPKDTSIMGNSYQAFRDHIPTSKICGCQDVTSTFTKNDKDRCEEIVKSTSKDVLDIFLKSSDTRLSSTIDSSEYSLYAGNCVKIKSKRESVLIKQESELRNFKYYSGIKNEGGFFYFNKNALELSLYDKSYLGWMNSQQFRCKCTGTAEQGCRILEGLVKDVVKNPSHAGNVTCPNFMSVKENVYGDIKAEDYKGIGGILSKAKVPSQASIKSNKKSNSLLRLAHFERVIQGGCHEKVKRYNECGKYAYRTIEQGCPERPDYCKDEALWLDTVE